MKSIQHSRSFLASVVGAALCWICSSLGAQVVVYRLEFQHEDGFNVDFYNGGYLVAPILGGDGSFVLTAIDNGRRVLDTSPGSGTYFLGREGDKRFNVLAATVGTGTSTARGSYVAFGVVNRTLTINRSAERIRIRIAWTMEGSAVAADDEGGEVKFNGSVGAANFSTLRAHLDERLTDTYNRKDMSVEEATEAVTRLLRWRGFAPPRAPAPEQPESGDGAGGGGGLFPGQPGGQFPGLPQG
jgi:hypothetical protein